MMSPRKYVWKFECEEVGKKDDNDILIPENHEQLIVHETLEQAVSLFRKEFKDRFVILEIHLLGECMHG